MNLTRTAITRPVFILMLMIASILMGTIAYRSMRLELNPEVAFPVVTITTVYPGAGPEEVNTLVSERIEDAVSGVTNMRELTSSSQEGVSVVIANFELGTNVDVALNDVRSRVDAVVNQLPDDAESPTVSKFDNASQPVLYLAFSSKQRNSRDLRDLLDDVVQDRFGQIKGVASASVQGGDVREIQIQLDKDKLLAYGIGIADITRQIAASTQNVPGGRLTEGDQEYTVRVQGEWKTVDQIRNAIITVNDPDNPQGASQSVRLSDVATIDDTIVERTQYSRLNKKDTVVLAVQKAREGNAVEITHQAEKVIEATLKEFPDLEVVKTLEQAEQIENSLEDLNFTLYFAVFLVAVTVFVFLHNFRGMLIVAIAIPICIFVAFVAMSLAGFTINNLSMLALILAVGVLVDDAIVVLENIYRHLKMGEDPREAALNGRGEIGLAALAITLADVVVFLPIGFMGGIVGQFFKPLALSYVFAVLVSLFVSFTVTPMLAARWYRAGEDLEHPKGAFSRAFERGFGRLEHAYRNVLEWSLNHRWFVFILGNTALVAIFMFIAGGFAGLSGNPLAGILPAPTGGIPAPWILFLVAIVVGGMVFVFNYMRGWNNQRITGPLYLGIAALAFIPQFLKLFSGPFAIQSFVLGLIGALISSLLIPSIVLIPVFVVMNLFKTHSRYRFFLNAAAFGLMFPAAAVLGGFYGKWKAEPPFKFEFIPTSDTASVSVAIELPPGSSLQATQRVVERVENVLTKNPNVEYVLSNIGSQGFGGFSGPGSSGGNYAQVQASLYDKGAPLDKLKALFGNKERLRWIPDTAVAAEVTEALGRIPGADVKVSTTNAQGFGSPVQLSLRGEDANQIVAAAVKIRDRLAAGAVKGVINADVSTTPGKPEIQAVPDRQRLADAGLTVGDIGASIRTLYTGDDSAKFRTGGREYDIRVQLSPKDRNNPDIVREVPVAFKQGNPVFLNQVANLVQKPSVDKIDRRDREVEVRVTADLLPGGAAGTAVQEVNQLLTKEKLIPAGVTLKPLGQADAQQREQGFLLGAFGLGLILVYMLLASLYDNLLYPLIIQLAQPQAITGAILALVLTNKPFSLIGFIGIITLIGLVGKNAILLVDYTNTLRDRGRNRHDALVEAGPVRLRPIAMTTIALILGTLPIALALGRGSEFRETIGIVIIGGITLSTLLTLVVIPCSYTIFDDASILIGQTLKRLRRTPPDPVVSDDSHGSVH
ncbi:MAG: efflux RND transporter permease subunit [Fimbriimonas sp.]